MRTFLLVAGLCLALPAQAQLFPSASLTHPLNRLTTPLSSIGDISVIADLDSSLSASYGGTGSSWTSLITSPADSTTQAANAFTTTGTFTGTAGQAAAYFAQTGTSNATLRAR